MKLVAPKDIYHIFIKGDRGTIIRCPNLRRFVKNNGIQYEIINGKWLINQVDFMDKVNPKGLTDKVKLPSLRSLRGCMKLWNSKYKQKSKLLDRHDMEEIIKMDGYFKWKYGNKWVINYEQLVPIIRIYLKERAERRKK